MIATIADLLEAFRRKEAELLDKQNITHAPTIGRMYEGLTRDILQKALPVALDLRVVSGFVTNSKSQLSKQIDCMLVSGEGERIPHTDDYKYHIRNVIAVIEVKKNLYSGDLDCAYKNLSSVREMQERQQLENRLFKDAYRLILQSDPDDDNINELPVWKRQIGLALYVESITPVRIVLGYHGFASEMSLRESFFKYLGNNLNTKGYGAADFPNLIICDGYSLVKLNGMPYGIAVTTNKAELYSMFGMPNIAEDAPIKGEMWPLYASYASNPMVLLLELIWTRLTYDEKLSPTVFGLDLTIEIVRPLLLARASQQNGEVGWYLEYFFLPQEILDRIPSTANWQPVEINQGQFAILAHLILRENSGITEGMDINSPELLAEFQNAEYSLTESIAFLQRVGFVAVEDSKLRLLTRECKVAALPDGKVVAGEDNAMRFSNWIANYMQEFRANKQ